MLQSLAIAESVYDFGMEVGDVVDKELLSSSEADTLHDVRLSDLSCASPEQIAAKLAEYENRLESVGLIVRGVAHDINNLLLVVGGFASLLQRTSTHDDMVNVASDGLGEAVQQMTSLARILSSLASRRPITFEKIDVNAVLASMDRTISHLLGDDILLEIGRDPLQGEIHAVHGQLERVLLNLVLNAREAMGAKGRLSIDARSLLIDDRNPQHQLAEGAYVVLTVADTGCGMSEATIQKIFDPSFTTKKAPEGCGYGLTTVRRIVQDCGGEIFVSSEVGQGTMFEIFLPRA